MLFSDGCDLCSVPCLHLVNYHWDCLRPAIVSEFSHGPMHFTSQCYEMVQHQKVCHSTLYVHYDLLKEKIMLETRNASYPILRSYFFSPDSDTGHLQVAMALNWELVTHCNWMKVIDSRTIEFYNDIDRETVFNVDWLVLRSLIHLTMSVLRLIPIRQIKSKHPF